MNSQIVRLAVVLLALTPVAAAESRQARYLNFSVVNKHGIYLRDLDRSEVTLLIDQQPVEVRFLGSQNVSTATVFLIENSPRTAQYNVSLPHWGRINTIDRVRFHLMDGFIESMVKVGPVLIAEFYRELELLHDFTEQDYSLVEALRRLKPKVAYLDKEDIPVARSLGWGADLLRSRPEKRKLLVLFTTVVDRESLANLDEYREMLRELDLDLYVVSFASRASGGIGYTHAERANRFFFKQLTDETSGRFYLSGEYAYNYEFLEDLRARLINLYTIGFYVRPSSEPETHTVRLEIDRPDCDITHRKVLIY